MNRWRKEFDTHPLWDTVAEIRRHLEVASRHTHRGRHQEAIRLRRLISEVGAMWLALRVSAFELFAKTVTTEQQDELRMEIGKMIFSEAGTEGGDEM